MAHFLTTPPVRSGMPLGGIGAASIELRPDGEFHEWQIANPQIFRVDSRDIHSADRGRRLSGSLSFYAAVYSGEKRWLRRLGLGFERGQDPDGEEYNDRMHSFNKTVQAVSCDAVFPVAHLSYLDDALPASIRMEAFSPFVPYDARTSATPGFCMAFSVRNTSEDPIEVCLAAKLRTLFPGNGQSNRLVRTGGRTVLEMVYDGADAGSLALSLSGSRVTALPGEYRKYMDEYVSYGEFGVVEESWLFDLLRNRALISGQSEETRQAPAWPDTVDNLSDEDVSRLLKALQAYGFAGSILDRNTTVDPSLTDCPDGRRRLLSCVLSNAARLRQMGPWGDGALCISMTLKPGEEQTVFSELAWYFPALISAGGSRVGHIYENWFGDALDVCRFLEQNRTEIREKVFHFRDNIFSSSFDPCYAEAVAAQLGNLVKSSWWTKDGDFGIWEGLGSCGFHTMDVSFYASFSLACLFPQLQMRQMEQSARFQRSDGRMPHCFNPDFSSVDNGFDRVDMNPQFILMVCRDYLSSGDTAYLKRMWPHVCLAMDSIASLDTDGDALPDRDTYANTYDAWHFSGASAYVSILWLAALQAGVLMARTLGQEERAGLWLAMLEKGKKAVEEKLFNGEYYDLWLDGDRRDICCMTDQMGGEYFTRVMGLDSILEESHVQSALEAVWRCNYSPENGLINAAYPPGAVPTLYTYRNCQGTANWSGIEYLMASFFLMTGHEAWGKSVVETVQERYMRCGEIFNHAECGDHYSRPMSSWVLLQALSGMCIQTALKTIRIRHSLLPEGGHAPWFASTGYGQILRRKQGWEIRCTRGTLSADRILTDKGCAEVTLRLSEGESFVLNFRNP